MSRVYFHSPSGTAELSGAERAHLSFAAKATARGYVATRPIRFHALLEPNHHLNDFRCDDTEAWAQFYETALNGSGKVIQYAGQPIESYALLLNTALESGDEHLRLAARIDGQCEIHGWVDGPNRAWLADLIQAALDAGTFREGIWVQPFHGGGERKWMDMGWSGVIALLRSRDDEPVVMSYSVCSEFPNAVIAGVAPDVEEDPEEEYAVAREAFEGLPFVDQWSAAMARLRSGYNGLELKPDNWEEFRFMHCLSMQDLAANDWEERVREAVEWMTSTPAAE